MEPRLRTFDVDALSAKDLTFKTKLLYSVIFEAGNKFWATGSLAKIGLSSKLTQYVNVRRSQLLQDSVLLNLCLFTGHFIYF